MEHSTTWLFIATAESSGNASSKMERSQERFPITRQLCSTIRPSSSEEFRTTRSARKRMSLTPISRAGTSLSSQVMFPNQEMITHFRRLIATVSSYLEGLWQEQELMRLTCVLRMEARLSGNALLRTVRAYLHLGLLRALHIKRANCTFLEEWMMIILNSKIFGSWIYKQRHGKRSLFQRVHLSPAQEVVIAQAFSKIRCISLVEFLK